MSQPNCKSRHRCGDGGEGECTQFQGHVGRHVCGSCLTLFGSGESVRPEQVHGPATQAATRPRSEGDGVTHWHCAHCGTEIPVSSLAYCVLCKYKICSSCGEANCPKTSSARTRDEGDGVTHWHCAHCGAKIPLNSPKCSECDYKVCPECVDNQNCCRIHTPRLTDADEGIDHRHCAHCGRKMGENTSVCSWCHFRICPACSEDTCLRPHSAGTRDAGDGVDHWHCAHCGVKIALNASVCGLCRYKICMSCSEVNCPRPNAAGARDAGDGVDHWHCAHCGTRIPLSASVCALCGYKICNGCSEAKCPKTLARHEEAL